MVDKVKREAEECLDEVIRQKLFTLYHVPSNNPSDISGHSISLHKVLNSG